jgi:hypothetical protein
MELPAVVSTTPEGLSIRGVKVIAKQATESNFEPLVARTTSDIITLQQTAANENPELQSTLV